MFTNWTDLVLDGYIVMTIDQISSSMFPSGRIFFENKLNKAIQEREKRNCKLQQDKILDSNHIEVNMKETIVPIYRHDVSSSYDPK